MKTISAREANHTFSRLLSEVEAGEVFVITKRGKVVARILPADDSEGALTDAQRRAAERLLEVMDRGYCFGGGRFGRAEMHER